MPRPISVPMWQKTPKETIASKSRKTKVVFHESRKGRYTEKLAGGEEDGRYYRLWAVWILRSWEPNQVEDCGWGGRGRGNSSSGWWWRRFTAWSQQLLISVVVLVFVTRWAWVSNVEHQVPSSEILRMCRRWERKTRQLSRKCRSSCSASSYRVEGLKSNATSKDRAWMT